MSIQDLCKEVLEQLECPVCMEFMLPPITLCDNGHNICSSCKEKVHKCPTCRKPLLDTRNKALEKLATRIECPCMNKLYGCTLTFPIALIREHQDVCEYNPLACPLQEQVHCSWKGSFQEVKNHVIEEHKVWATNMSGMTEFYIKNFNENIAHVYMFLLNDDIFHQRFEVIDRTVYYVIRYIGTSEKASEFKYQFKLITGSNEISVCNVVSSYSVDVQEVYNSGNCVKLYYDTLERFMDENSNLKFFVEISKV
jgi:E3 ubiquitin-protein ligase SIAH1